MFETFHGLRSTSGVVFKKTPSLSLVAWASAARVAGCLSGGFPGFVRKLSGPCPVHVEHIFQDIPSNVNKETWALPLGTHGELVDELRGRGLTYRECRSPNFAWRSDTTSIVSKIATVRFGAGGPAKIRAGEESPREPATEPATDDLHFNPYEPIRLIDRKKGTHRASPAATSRGAQSSHATPP